MLIFHFINLILIINPKSMQSKLKLGNRSIFKLLVSAEFSRGAVSFDEMERYDLLFAMRVTLGSPYYDFML